MRCPGPAGLPAGKAGFPGAWGQGGCYQETDDTTAFGEEKERGPGLPTGFSKIILIVVIH